MPMASGRDGKGMGKVGRPANILSLGFFPRDAEWTLETARRECRADTDLILLPETCLGEAPLAIDDPVVDRFRALARALGAYVVLPFFRKSETHGRLNTALIIGRDGADAGTYDKAYPYWAEFDMAPPGDPGDACPVFDLDFGRVGLAICFDANFPRVFERMADAGAELVLWPSAYSAGLSLVAHAINYQLPIVTATYVPDCMVCNAAGREVYYQRGDEGGVNVSHVRVDLDECVFHENFNMEAKDRLLREHGDDVALAAWHRREQWFVLRATRPGASARALAKAYGMEELRAYKQRSRRDIDKMRGFAI